MRTSKVNAGTIMPVSLRDVYAATGSYSAKLLIKQNVSISAEKIDVTMRDADGKQMPVSFKRWGTKLNLEFDITSDTPDGVAVIDVHVWTKSHSFIERLDCWIIK